MKNNVYFIIVLFIILGCNSKKKEIEAKKEADFVIEHLNDFEIIKKFSPKYFPKQKTYNLIRDIKASCDWNNRQGGYRGMIAKIGSGNRIAFFYEFKLVCDTLRFTLTYDIEPKVPQLVYLKIDQI